MERWSEDLRKVRRILLRTLRTSDRFREPLTEALESLENLDDQLRALAEAYRPKRRKAACPIGRYQPKRYTVEQRRRSSFLYEYRVGGRAQPFCGSREDYDATAETLAGLDNWTQFDDLKTLVDKHTGHIQPDHLVRVCLRFWQATNPPIVEKDRTFYRAGVRGSFRGAAKRVWRELENLAGK